MFKIYVGNLDYKVKVEQLRELFAVYAPIEDLVIPLDPKTNRAKGFGIVMIRDPELGRAAVKAMQGKRLMGRTLVVNEAVKKKKSGAPEPISKADLVRNGPFGPRMYRVGDPRGRVTRNPRRSATTGTGPAPSSGASAAGLPANVSAHSPANSPANSSANSSASSPPASAPARPVPPAATPKPAAAPTRPAASEARPVARPVAGPAARTASAATPPTPAPAPAVPARPKATKLATPKRPSGDGGSPPPAPAAG